MAVQGTPLLKLLLAVLGERHIGAKGVPQRFADVIRLFGHLL